MRNKLFLCLVVGILAYTFPVLAQVSIRTGSVYGKVIDDKGAPLPGVAITLESSQIPTQTATTQSSGGFRFANLPPGTYSVNFSLEGFTEVRQEEVRVTVGSTVELDITLKASLTEEFTVIGETPVVDTTKQKTNPLTIVNISIRYPAVVIPGSSWIRHLVSITIDTMLPVPNPDNKQVSLHAARL